MKNGALRDAQAALKSNRIRRVPTGGQHRRYQIVLVADKGKIQRITMYACAGCRNPRSSRYRFMPGIKNLPDHWNQEISRQQPDRHQAKQDSDNNWDWPSREKGVRGVQGVAG